MSMYDTEAIATRLQDTSRSVVEELHKLQQEELVPAHYFERLACSWARRALDDEVKAGREPDSRLVDALSLKEQWLDGQADETTLEAAHQQARQAAHEASARGTGYEAAASAADASGGAGYALRAVAWATVAKVYQHHPEQEQAIRTRDGEEQISAFLALLRQ